MRFRAAAGNRTALVLLGLLLVLLGAAGLLLSTGWGARLVGDQILIPARSDTVVPSGVDGWLQNWWGVTAVGVGGLLLAMAGLVWLVRQVPRRGLAKPFRLSDDAHGGLTTVDPQVLCRAVEQQVGDFRGVTRADAQIGGAAARPELTLRVGVEERADVTRVLSQVQREAAPALAQALDASLGRLQVQVEVDRVRQNRDQVEVSPLR